jgi:archaeal flagellar protein FlaI
MQFPQEAKLYDYEIEKDSGEDVLYINYSGANYVPDLASSHEVMERTIDLLIENPNVSRIVFVQDKNYNYDFRETSYLLEIASLYVYLLKQEKVLSPEKLVLHSNEMLNSRYNEIFSFLFLLKKDPVAAYVDLKKLLFKANASFSKLSEREKFDQKNYIDLLEKIFSLLDETSIIQDSKKYLDNYSKGNREIYFSLFKPDIIPNFSFTRLVRDIPRDAEIIDQYEISSAKYDVSRVILLRKKEESKMFYYLIPPEHYLSEDENSLLNLARGVLIEHQPKAEDYLDVQRIRSIFFNLSRDLIRDLADSKKISLEYSDLNKLATILVRHTIGFGLIEVLLQDKKIQDISLNAPIPKNPVYVRHQSYDECSTNILASKEDSDSWAAKFRMISGRPLDEANPILDTQLEIGDLRSRIAIIQGPLSPDGLAYSLRRHRENPWTLPLFIENKMINPLAAGLLSFLIDGSRTLLVAGTRSSGKTSLLGSLMLEINPKYRVITVEDSLELPVESLRKLKYNILRMKVRSALLKTTSEVSADDGIRTSLRLGDSSLIVGEVRSVEAKALYEAMRVGALANVVAGTIHGASPYGVYDRVVNDLGVPATSFKATDIIIICNPIKSADGLHSFRRVLQISEVRKHWEKDPLIEKGFIDLMRYNVEKDELEATESLINGDSEIVKEIASKVKGWAGNWDAVYDNILLRAEIKNEVVKVAKDLGKRQILEAEFNTLSNHMFHKFSEEVIKEKGLPLKKYVFPLWKEWLNGEIKKI